MSEICIRAPHIVPESGQYHLLCADIDGVYERTTRDFIHYSHPRPLIGEEDRAGITGWASPHLSGDTLTVTVDTADGRHGIRLFSTEEYMPGYSMFRPAGGIVTPPDWDCTDGQLFRDQLFFTRRTARGSDIYMQMLRVGFVPWGKPRLILRGGEAPALWFARAEQPAMLYFHRGKAALAAAPSLWEPEWKKIPLPIPVGGVSASLYEEMDGSFMAMIGQEDGGMRFCHLEWKDGSCALIPRDPV